MTEKENPCAKGLTPECFKRYPKYAKKVFAYKLLQAVLGSPLSADLQKMLWRHLVQVPISWMSWEDFIIPDDIPLEEIISDDWDPDDPLPDELTINLNEIIPDDYEEGDELPDGVTIEPGTEIPDDWKVGDEIPAGINIDTSELFPDDWSSGDPLPEGIVINIDVVLPEFWTVGEDLPFGITVDPDFKIETAMLATMGIFVEPGKTYEEVFPNGWDPTSELPKGASFVPYEKTTEIKPAAIPPLYVGIGEPGPVHRVSPSPISAIEPWFYDEFLSLDPAVWDDALLDPARVYVDNSLLIFNIEVAGPQRTLYTWGTIPVAFDYDISFTLEYPTGDSDIDFYFRAGNTRFTIKFSFTPDEIVITSGINTQSTTVNFYPEKYDYEGEIRNGLLTLYQNGIAIISDLSLEVVATGYYEVRLRQWGGGKTYNDYIKIFPTE